MAYLLLILAVLAAPSTAATQVQPQPGYAGSESCVTCHDEIGRIQRQSNMARTWRSRQDSPFSGRYRRETEDGPAPFIRYGVAGDEESLTYSVEMPGQEKIVLPVEAVTGGPRFGIGFLARIDSLEGAPLYRAALMESRYRHNSQTGQLSLTAGHSPQKPVSYERAIGRVLTPSFEKKCLTCHRSPAHSPSGEAGVGCEDCHGAGKAHIQAIEEGESDLKMVHPAGLESEKLLEICGQCHASLDEVSQDPLPQDLLISNQVTALRMTECYIQSGGGFSCISCHDPHQNAAAVADRFLATCLSCHSPEKAEVTLCPVNSSSGCIECHMPRLRQGALVDHWIRVAGTDSSAGTKPDTRFRPRRLFLRRLTVQSLSLAEEIEKQLAAGADFHLLAQQHSIDPAARDGGFLGSIEVADMSPVLADAGAVLGPNEISPIVGTGDAYVLLQRMPRDFRWRAEAVRQQGESLSRTGKSERATAALQQALRIHPHSLRALLWLGIEKRNQKDFRASIDILEKALTIYPGDASIAYNLGLVYGFGGDPAREERLLRRSIELDGDFLDPRVRLGVVLFSQRRFDEASAQFEAALEANPLAAAAYYNLGKTREAQGRVEEAGQALQMAAKINPRFAPR